MVARHPAIAVVIIMTAHTSISNIGQTSTTHRPPTGKIANIKVDSIQGRMKHLTIDPSAAIPPTRDYPSDAKLPESLPNAKETKLHPSNAGGENASLLFIGTATTIL